MPDDVKPGSPLPWAVGVNESGISYVADATGAEVFLGVDIDVDRRVIAACNAHPGLVARVAALEAENARMREALEAVCRNDKTPAYEYGEKNALGHPPRQPGQRWNTPAEMARAALTPKEPQ